MTYDAGRDVSLEQSSLCVIDDAGAVVLERRVATEPEAIAAALAALPERPARLLLETGGLTPWLWHELSARLVAGAPTFSLCWRGHDLYRGRWARGRERLRCRPE